MVTKLVPTGALKYLGSVLAKILMVTKLNHMCLFLASKFCSSKNPYGNKTTFSVYCFIYMFCSSKNPYDNKTDCRIVLCHEMFCSSKNPYGNKTLKHCIIRTNWFCSSKNPYGNKTEWFNNQ